MDRTIWKLTRTGERLWMLAVVAAAHAAALENAGKGLNIVAEETRWLANCIHAAVEKVEVEGEELNREEITDLAAELDLLAFNGAIEASRITGPMGRQAAIYAGEIRELADGVLCLFDGELAARKKQFAAPWAADPSSAARNGEFLLLNAGGIPFVEPLVNIQEVCVAFTRGESTIRLRDREYPFIDLYERLGRKQESPTHVILRTPWAGEEKICAVNADVSAIFFSPIGKPAAVPANMPLAAYVRECWENENGEPFYFMDWTKLL